MPCSRRYVPVAILVETAQDFFEVASGGVEIASAKWEAGERSWRWVQRAYPSLLRQGQGQSSTKPLLTSYQIVRNTVMMAVSSCLPSLAVSLTRRLAALGPSCRLHQPRRKSRGVQLGS